MKRSQPPALATWLLERTNTDPAIIGDLAEEYANGRTPSWYWKQAIVALSPVTVRAFRWCVALPVALLAAVSVPEIVLVFSRTIPFSDLPSVMYVSLVFFVMSAIFVSVGVGIVPARKASFARIALTVVLFFGASPFGQYFLGEPIQTEPFLIGICISLGGVAGYLPWRRRPSDA